MGKGAGSFAEVVRPDQAVQLSIIHMLDQAREAGNEGLAVTGFLEHYLPVPLQGLRGAQGCGKISEAGVARLFEIQSRLRAAVDEAAWQAQHLEPRIGEL